ncbi:MAG: hypothetical protein RLZZ618_2490 [Pseudomonadota bacterium]
MRALPLFVPNTPKEIALIQSLKRGQIQFSAGEALIHEGQSSAPLFTLFSGWAFRFKTLSDGRRQILNFLLPGDFIGVQQRMGDDSAHGVEAITDASVCAFQRDALWELHASAPQLGFNITWMTAHEESLVDDSLLSVGRRSAEERIATLLILLYKRVAALLPGLPLRSVPFPLTQQHIADALGLSLVHTNKTLRKLERRGLHRIVDGELSLSNPSALAKLADLYGDGTPVPRPLI